ncbi:hypothetical protein [Neobacillus niacini]|uniref:hypothetical protein n=1 Tax=Neobacillus niacini TaxID=86668 RepID=UPI003983A547
MYKKPQHFAVVFAFYTFNLFAFTNNDKSGKMVVNPLYKGVDMFTIITSVLTSP